MAFKELTSGFIALILSVLSAPLWAQTDNNTVLGYQAGNNSISGSSNTLIGSYTGNHVSSGYNNTFIGFSAGINTTSGHGNTFIGAGVGSANTTGFYNLFIGNSSGINNTSGSFNTFFGNGTGTANTTGEYNVFIGHTAGYNNTTGIRNIFMGQGAGANNTVGGYNVFLGFGAGGANTSAEHNVFLGSGTGLSNQTGQENVFIGHNAGYNTNAHYNVGIGLSALDGNITGYDNVAIGRGAGTTFNNLVNSVALGAFAKASQSNTIILGATGSYAVNVGINNTAPGNKLEITQGTTGNSGLRFTNLTKNFSPSLSTTKFLTVDTNGDVVLANYGTPNFRLAADSVSSDWKPVGNGFIQNTNEGGVIIGQGIEKTPEGYNLFVSKGLLTEKVKVAVKSTDDWSDNVFLKSYKLPSLSQVDNYIQQHGHLPGIPSAKEMVKQGNDLHQTDTRLLQKIEELTLYLIQQRQELDQLREQNKQISEELDTLKSKINH